MEKKFVYFDVETGGLDFKVNPILSLAMLYEYKDKRDSLVVYIKPEQDQVCEAGALEVNGFTMKEINSDKFVSYKEAYSIIIKWLSGKINKFDKRDKAWLVGFNSQSFDTPFLIELFNRNSDKYFFSWFWPENMDVRILAGMKLMNQRPSMPNFKLMTVAKHIGLNIDESKAHDAIYDVEITREIFKKLYPGLYHFLI